MNQRQQLQHRLRLFDATTLVVGSMIGSAIFLALPIMAREAPSPAALIALWSVGGLFTVLGANCCAELAAMIPQAGGPYVFIREAETLAHGRPPLDTSRTRRYGVPRTMSNPLSIGDHR